MYLPKAIQADDTNRNRVKRKANHRAAQKQFSADEQELWGNHHHRRVYNGERNRPSS